MSLGEVKGWGCLGREGGRVGGGERWIPISPEMGGRYPWISGGRQTSTWLIGVAPCCVMATDDLLSICSTCMQQQLYCSPVTYQSKLLES